MGNCLSGSSSSAAVRSSGDVCGGGSGISSRKQKSGATTRTTSTTIAASMPINEKSKSSPASIVVDKSSSSPIRQAEQASHSHHSSVNFDSSANSLSSSSGNGNDGNGNNNSSSPTSSRHHHAHAKTDPTASSFSSTSSPTTESQHRRRKSRHELCHSDSKVGLTDILCGDLKNPNLVRIEVPLGKPIEEVYSGVHDGPVLGSGISGIVRLVTHKETSVSYACKCLDLALIDNEEGLRQLKEEIYIMCQLDHPNIIRLEEVYESHSEIYLVQEVCKGGELFDRLDEQPDYHYTEAQCARLVKQMLSSLRYIHNKGIIHRDLKLENFLFSDFDADSELKMIDFGLSKHFTFGEVHHEAVGTPYTVAPEVIRGSYDERCDVWAIGVITYLLLSGEPPFGGCGGPEPLMQVRDNILNGDFRFEPREIWQAVSQDAKDFITRLLVVDPLDRPTAQVAQELKWLKKWSTKERFENGEDSMINPSVVRALVGFKEYSDMRKLLCEVLSFTLLPDQIQDLRKEFEKYDQEGTGEITLSTLKKVLIGNASTGSLGGLTEAEVVDIFNAMRVRKGETSIRWHDFIAAGMSQCQVDDRNLRLAFGRLDQENKGYISFENVMDITGDIVFESEDEMLTMWRESLKDVNCKGALITYEDFVLLMKGQARDSRSRSSSLQGLAAVPEIPVEDEEESHTSNESDIPIEPLVNIAPSKPPTMTKEPSIDLSLVCSPKQVSDDKVYGRTNSSSAPTTPILHGKSFCENESPIDAEDVGGVTFNEKPTIFTIPDLNLTPPQTPVRGPADYVTPTVGRGTISPQLLSLISPPIIPVLSSTRGRSISLDEKELPSNQEEPTTHSLNLKRDSRRAMAIPEHIHKPSDIDSQGKDRAFLETCSLRCNRNLYRAHREFRHAVTEACKRFELEQMRRAEVVLKAKEQASAKSKAGLVMRHGQGLSEQSIKDFLKKTMDEQQKQVDQANRRGGRGRGSRKKTISDMSGMLGGSVSSGTEVTGVQSEEVLAPVNEDENLLRNPTRPGEFRKTTYDPFQSMRTLPGGPNEVHLRCMNSRSVSLDEIDRITS